MSSRYKLLHRLSQIPVLLAVTALFTLMCMTFADVILRSAFNQPIEAATELTRWLMAIVVFASLPAVSFKGQHISVDLLDKLFPTALARFRDSLLSLICGAMLILPAHRTWVLAERARSYGDVTEYLNWPQHYIGWFISAATYATVAVLILRGLLLLFRPDWQKSDEAIYEEDAS